MFLMSQGQKPDSTDSLQRILAESLNLSFQVQDGERRVAATGSWPDMERLSVDLTGIRVHPFQPPPAPSAWTTDTGSAPVRCARLELVAAPMQLAPSGDLHLQVRADGAELSYVVDRENRRWLLPTHFTTGNVEARISAGDLEHVFLENARDAAAAHGVTVEEGRLQLHQTGPRQLQVQAELSARKLFVKGRLSLQGRLELDTQLNIRFSGLSCNGHGMVASLATQFLQPHLASWENRSIPLLAAAMPGVRLHHAGLQATPEGQIHATAELGEP
jgi:hypothetical protein